MVARGPGRARPTRNILHETDMNLLPAIDLHLHIDGAVRTETILDLAREQGIALPAATPAELEAYVRVSPNCSSLTEFLATFNVFYPLLKSPDALRRISAELMEDLDADGVLYAELRFAPALNLPHDTPPEATEAGMERVVAAVLEGMRDGLVRSRGSLIGAGLILCCYRGLALELAHRTVRVATRFSRETGGGEDVRLCGVDLAGDESRYPAGDFAEVFDFAREHGLRRTVHAGEAAGARSVRDALDLLHAERIGHGIRTEEDPALLERVIRDEIPLEICLSSNLHTATVSGLDRHPLRRYLDAGARVTINTDDPRVSGITLSGEWELATRQFALGPAEQRRILQNSVAASFAPAELRARMRERIDEYFAGRA